MSISRQGIFISRVNKGGASEKAGVHVGDRLLEVGWEYFFKYICKLMFVISYPLQSVWNYFLLAARISLWNLPLVFLLWPMEGIIGPAETLLGLPQPQYETYK